MNAATPTPAGGGYTALQIRCPFCNAAATARPGDSCVCEFCLRPFTVVQAQSEEQRLRAEIAKWLEQKVGASAALGGVADASSRSFIFQQRILPELRRDVDRALERVGSFAHHPLVPVPIPSRTASKQTSPNPLTERRSDVLALRALRSRLESDHVVAFALEGADRETIRAMDRRLANVLHLSNLTEAARRGDATGYESARKNLEVLVEELGASLASAAPPPPDEARVRAALRDRYTGLAELCRVCEEVLTPNAILGAPLSERLDRVAQQLEAAAQTMEQSRFNPIETMPMVLAAREELATTRLFARWLRSYDAICGGGLTSFAAFAEATGGLLSAASTPNGALELLEACTSVVQAMAGRAPIPVDQDFSWARAFAEMGRKRKSLGMFGAEEQVAGIEEFFHPVWVAEIVASRNAGVVFTSGVEQRQLALVSACEAGADRVVFLTDGRTAQALARPASVARRSFAFPRISVTQVQPLFEQAIRARPELLNARFRITGIALVPAVIVRYAERAGSREVVGCLNGQLRLSEGARGQLDASSRLLRSLG